MDRFVEPAGTLLAKIPLRSPSGIRYFDLKKRKDNSKFLGFFCQKSSDKNKRGERECEWAAAS
jgi:hypothetical protein